jgi:hypothetical protein
MTIAVFIIITGLVTFYCLAPLLRAREVWLTTVEHGAERKVLEQEKNSYLRAIKDIEFEHASNKINDQDYEELKRDYTIKAARVIQDLEQIHEEEELVTPIPEEQSENVPDDVTKLQNKIDMLTAQLEELQGAMERGEIDEMDYLDLSDPVNRALEKSRKTLAELTNQ